MHAKGQNCTRVINIGFGLVENNCSNNHNDNGSALSLPYTLFALIDRHFFKRVATIFNKLKANCSQGVRTVD